MLNLFYILVSLVLLAGFLLANMKYANPVAAADVRAAAEIAARLHVAQAGMRAYIADVFEAKGELTFGADADVRAALVPEYITLPPAKSGVTWHVGVSALDSRNIFICATGVSGTLGELGLRQLVREFSADDLVFGASACEEYGTDVSTADALTLYVRGSHTQNKTRFPQLTAENFRPVESYWYIEPDWRQDHQTHPCLRISVGEFCTITGTDGVDYTVQYIADEKAPDVYDNTYTPFSRTGNRMFVALDYESAESEVFYFERSDGGGWSPLAGWYPSTDNVFDIPTEFNTALVEHYLSVLSSDPLFQTYAADIRALPLTAEWVRSAYRIAALPPYLSIPDRVCAQKPGGFWYYSPSASDVAEYVAWGRPFYGYPGYSGYSTSGNNIPLHPISFLDDGSDAWLDPAMSVFAHPVPSQDYKYSYTFKLRPDSTYQSSYRAGSSSFQRVRCSALLPVIDFFAQGQAR